MFNAFKTWRAKVRTYNALKNLDRRQLDDIGVESLDKLEFSRKFHWL